MFTSNATTTNVAHTNAPTSKVATMTARVFIGFLQGILLTLLYHSIDTHLHWPATQPGLFLPMLVLALFLPLLIVQSLGNMRLKTLLIWASSAAVILFGICYYEIFRQPISLPPLSSEMLSPTILLDVCFLAAIALFIAHALILSCDIDNSPTQASDKHKSRYKYFMASYATYFDVAWKLGIQLVFTILFVQTFWILLSLGSGLFQIIHLKFFSDIIYNAWFAIPATTTMTALALHITDVKANIINGMRNLCLVLLSYLLPLITLIIGLFLFSLTFTGPSLLWQTGHASVLLLVSALALIILINAAYQNGLTPLSKIKRYVLSLACCLITPLIALAIYALSLRVQQYGWSPSRIYVAACMLIIAAYAISYLVAVFMVFMAFIRRLRHERPLKFIETGNLAVAWLILAIYLAISSPVADPAKLSVANQISRLQAGKISPDKFDFTVLRYDGLRFGQAALENLQNTWQGPQAKYVQEQAKAALALEIAPSNQPSLNAKNTNSAKNTSSAKNAKNTETKNELIILHTKNSKLPDSFLKQTWGQASEHGFNFPSCLSEKNSVCHAWIVQGHNKAPMVIIFQEMYFTGFQQQANGSWQDIGNWSVPYSCKIQQALQDNFKMVLTKPSQDDIEILGWRTHFESSDQSNPCRK
jgi:hypothetical protein